MIPAKQPAMIPAEFVGSVINTFCRFADARDLRTYGPALAAALEGYVKKLGTSDEAKYRADAVHWLDTVTTRGRSRSL